MMRVFIFFIISLFCIQCSVKNNANNKIDFKIDTLTYFDQSRNRKIPVAIYQSKKIKNSNKTPIIFSHGYGENKGDDYLFAYTYLTEFLASKGYFVISIQHELPTDELLAMSGKLQETRRPNWERGSQNIFFVLQEIKKQFPELKFNKLTLIGHSNGGDMTALFTQKYPELVNKVILMDNRRMEIPRLSKPKIYSLRSNDYSPDENILPTDAEAKKYGIVVEFTDINHSNMDNDANGKERKYLTEKILAYLK